MTALLLNPGPVTLSERVRNAMLRPDLCHREQEFSTLQSAIGSKLLRLYDLDPDIWAAVLLTGSGTAAVEAMITSLVPATGKLLVLENGVYGERMSQIARQSHIDTMALSAAWGEPIDNTKIKHTLSRDPAVTHVAVVHHETTTGRLNDLRELSDICTAHKAVLLCDTVSSFGAEAIDFINWPIAACAATANKCLHGVPGTAFVICRRRAVTAGNASSVYLDLATYLEKQDAGGTPFTQSVQTFYALDEALDELFEAGGVCERRTMYVERMRQVRRTLIELGVVPLLGETETSCVLHAFEMPADLGYGRLHDELKARGFVIYAGQGPYADQIFRISMMGAIEAADIQRLVKALRDLIPIRRTGG